MTGQDSILHTHRLTKRFGKRTAVRDLDIEVLRGDIYGFLGPNGAGKSTTIRMALSLITPTAGSVELFGRNIVRDRSALARVGGLVERPDFYLYLSARKNLEIVQSLYGHVDRKRVDAVLDIVGLLDRAGDRVKGYSHGMKQRLGIAQALLPNPEFLILDEPTNGLDPQGMKEVRDMIMELNRDHGMTILLSSHLLNEIEQVATRMCIIHQGELKVQGEVRTLMSRDHLTVRIVGNPREALLTALGSLSWVQDVVAEAEAVSCTVPREKLAATNCTLVGQGIEVSTFTPRYSLEDYFLSITEAPAEGVAS